jgi:hypothetical protein
MGNMPSQRPPEGTESEGDAPDAGTGVFGRVARGAHSLVAAVSRRLSILPDLDLTTAFRLNDERDMPRRPLAGTAQRDTEAKLPATTESALPARDRPFTSPSREGTANPPDLSATERDGRLSVYYPGRDGAKITSDTYERVKR